MARADNAGGAAIAVWFTVIYQDDPPEPKRRTLEFINASGHIGFGYYTVSYVYGPAKPATANRVAKPKRPAGF